MVTRGCNKVSINSKCKGSLRHLDLSSVPSGPSIQKPSSSPPALPLLSESLSSDSDSDSSSSSSSFCLLSSMMSIKIEGYSPTTHEAAMNTSHTVSLAGPCNSS